MTVGIRIINVGNNEQDLVRYRYKRGIQGEHVRLAKVPDDDELWHTLERGAITEILDVGPEPVYLCITGKHGEGEAAGELDVFVVDRAYHKGDCPAPGTFT